LSRAIVEAERETRVVKALGVGAQTETLFENAYARLSTIMPVGWCRHDNVVPRRGTACEVDHSCLLLAAPGRALDGKIAPASVYEGSDIHSPRLDWDRRCVRERSSGNGSI